MFNFSPEKLFLVAIIALVVLGPHRLPQAARNLGRFMAHLRHMSSSFQDEVRGALSEPVDAFNSAIGDFRPQDVPRSVRQAITNTLITPPSPASPSPAQSPSSGPPSSAAPSPPASDAQVPHPASFPVAPDDPSLN
jgi:sec-independent protein translocase protein TatB